MEKCLRYFWKPTLGFSWTKVCLKNLFHRQVKYLNNIIEADHGKLKRLVKPVRSFKSMSDLKS